MTEYKPQILIVEDQKIAVRDLTIILEAAGYEVCGSFTDGEKAIEGISRLVPDVIFLDIRIVGEIDGIELAEHLKLFYDIPFIYLTSNSDPETLDRAVKTEPKAFITKPFHPQQILSAVALALHKPTNTKSVYDYGRFNKIVTYIQNNIDRDIRLAEMAKVMDMNSSYFCRIFQQEIGVSPHQFILQLRIEKAKQMLKQNAEASILDIALSCGFSSQSILNRHFRKFVGTTPTQYRKEG
jgi:YesN/AraC family two-component response regulator